MRFMRSSALRRDQIGMVRDRPSFADCRASNVRRPGTVSTASAPERKRATCGANRLAESSAACRPPPRLRSGPWQGLPGNAGRQASRRTGCLQIAKFCLRQAEERVPVRRDWEVRALVWIRKKIEQPLHGRGSCHPALPVVSGTRWGGSGKFLCPLNDRAVSSSVPRSPFRSTRQCGAGLRPSFAARLRPNGTGG